jgi:N-acetylmuramoyl-L-alanine amidase
MTFALEIAARTVWQEARGEPEEGQRAVAHVIVNRMNDGRWGKSLASVCLADRQFSGWNNSDPNRIAACTLPDDNASLARFREFLTEAMTGASPDPTKGARWYYNPSVVAKPAWDQGQVFVQIGAHRFFRDDHK